MENDIKPKEAKFSDYIYILYKWKNFIIINLLLVTIVVTIFAFLLPKTYKAKAIIMVPPNDQMGLGGLTSLLGNKSSIASMGSRLFGVANTSEDVLLGIINSRTSLTEVINKFDLMKYYEIDDNNIDKALKAFQNDISVEPNEYGMIEFSIINKNPMLSADIANYLVALVDSLNIQINIQRAKNNRMFIEKRYIQNVNDLKKAEDSLYKFQKKYGIVAVPEQLEVTVKAAAEIEAMLMKKEMESFFILQGYGENAPQYQGVKAEINLLKKKVQELKNSPNLSASSNILFAFNDMPNIAVQYLRTYREVEIQQSILEIVMPMYEQAKVEEQKSIPTIIVIDKAIPPQLKDAPKKAFIIVSLSFLTFFFLILVAYRGEIAIHRQEIGNPLEESESKVFKKIKNFYHVKF